MPSVPVSDFKDQVVTHIVSLGPRCATTYNLRRHYNFASAYPFDWWITPDSGILRVLRDMDVDAIYDPDHLMLTDRNDSVVHAPLGLLLHHEFPRDSSKPNRPVIANFREAIDLPRHRTRHLFEKFLALNDRSNRVVFFREGGVGPDLETALSRLFTDCVWSVARIPSPRTRMDGFATPPNGIRFSRLFA